MDAGVIDTSMSRAEISAAVFSEIMAQNPPQTIAEYGAFDWDSLLAFIEKLLPLILQLIALFG